MDDSMDNSMDNANANVTNLTLIFLFCESNVTNLTLVLHEYHTSPSMSHLDILNTYTHACKHFSSPRMY